MGNSLRCCLACVIPCGALDLIRIVHLNGHVEEIAHPITAAEVLNNNPNHVLSKPSSQGVVRRIMILSPESELKRGCIYFLIPATSVPSDKKKTKKVCLHVNINAAAETDHCSNHVAPPPPAEKKKSPYRRCRRRSGKVGIWRPHLESISED